MNFFQEHFLPMWRSGGPLMWPLLFLALAIYFTALQLLVYLMRRPVMRASKDELARAVANPSGAVGELAQIVGFVQREGPGVDETFKRFAQVRSTYVRPLERRTDFLLVLVGAAPLAGLLGTVMGMLETFRGLAASVGGQTVDLVAGGISQALITTQAGLIVAIPGYVMAGMITKRVHLLEAQLILIECLAVQRVQENADKPQELSA